MPAIGQRARLIETSNYLDLFGVRNFSRQIVTPPVLSAGADNYPIRDGSRYALASSAPVTLTGLAADQAWNGLDLDLINVGANNISLTNMDSASLAINRILTGTGGTLVIAPGNIVSLFYDQSLPGWRVVTSPGGGGGTDPTAYHAGDVNLTPTADGTQILGTNAKQLQEVFSEAYTSYAHSADAQPAVLIMGAGPNGGVIALGRGGSNPAAFVLEQSPSDGVALIPTGAKLQQTDAPTAGPDLCNKTYVDGHSGSGPFQLIQTILVTGSPVNSITFSGLNGDTDAHYLLFADFIGGGGGAFSVWLSTDFMVGSVINSQNMAGGSPQLNWFIGRASVVTGNSYHIVAEFNSKTGRFRQGRSQLSNFIPGSGINFEDWVWGCEETTIDMTEITLNSDSGGNAFAVGSTFSLYRVKDA